MKLARCTFVFFFFLLPCFALAESSSDALRQSLEEYRSKNFARSIEFARRAQKDSHLKPWAQLLLAKGHEARGALQEALEIYGLISSSSAASLDAQVGKIRIRVLKGRSGHLEKMEDEVSSLESEIGAANRDDLRRELKFLRGKIAMIEGDAKSALEFFSSARSGSNKPEIVRPAREEAAEALARIVQANDPSSVEVLKLEAQLLLKENEPALALNILQSAKNRAGEHRGSQDSIALLQEGAYRALGKDEEADKQLEEVIRRGERANGEEALSRLIKKSWNKDDSTKTRERIERFRNSYGLDARRDELMFIEASNLESSGQEKRAEELFLKLAHTERESSFRVRSLRKVAWMSFAHGDFQESAKRFADAADILSAEFDEQRQSLLKVYNAPPDTSNDTASARAKLRVLRDTLDELLHHRYWLARTLAKLPENSRRAISSDSTREILAKLSELAPNTYYGMLSRSEGQMLLSAPEPAECHLSVPPATRELLSRLKEASYREAAQAEIDWFLKDRLMKEKALRDIAAAGGKRLSRSDTSYFITQIELGTEFGNPSPATGLAESFYKRPRAIEPFENEARACANRFEQLAFPTPFLAAFENSAEINAVPISLLYAHAKTESFFDPLAQSPKDARGLMQMLRSTAQAEGFPADGNLFDPELNVFYGGKHLAKLLQKYERKIPLAASAYNAGADATEKWKRKFSTEDLEAWTESISYPETRDYVKKIVFAKRLYDLRLTTKAK